MARHSWDAPIKDGMQWWGAGPEVPWGEVEDPFELQGQDRKDYPEGSSLVVEWLKEQGQPLFTRKQLSRVARRFGLYDRGHKGYKFYGVPTVFQALEILEVYDYIRTVTQIRGNRRGFLVNPRVLLLPRPIAVIAPDPPPVVNRDPRRNFNADEKRELWILAGGRCCICRVPLPPNWHADHVIPWVLGGLTTTANGMALCPTCNLAKNARMPDGRK